MKNSRLIYKSPAKIWTDALPLGNGRMGAMVYGRLDCEKLQFNEETLWSGYHDDIADNPECAIKLHEIRQLLFDGKLKQAEEMANEYFVCRGMGAGKNYTPANTIAYGSFETAGQLYILLHENAQSQNYTRTLDLQNARAAVDYLIDGKKYNREYFISEKYSCLCGRLSCDEPIFAKFVYTRDNADISYDNDLIVMQGHFDKGIDFAAAIKIVGGSSDGKSVSIKSPDIRFYVSIKTSYTGITNVTEEAVADVERASKVDYEKIKNQSFERVSRLMERCSIDIGQDCDTPTDKRLCNLQNGKADVSEIASLSELYFNYGRYLMISSSRNCVLPSNLQGIWTNDYNTIWSADYHININIQMNYWLTEVTDLSECGDVFLRYIKFLANHGKKTADVNYGMKGWVAHTVTNPWGFTAPGHSFSWGSFMCAGAWCCEHIWERWLYSKDIDFLREYYPVLKGSCEFFMDFLTQDKNTGYFVTAPSNSPENKYVDPNTGACVAICAGPTMDNCILYELFTNTANAAKILNADSDFAKQLIELRDKLPPIKIGKHGQIMEWQEDFEESEPGHRHLSMLYGLHPSNLITKSKTQELFEAAKVSIDRRLSHGGAHTGWSRAWIINFYARLGKGNECLEHITALLEKSTYPNLFDSHPPFQIDGNFGGCAGISEMLLQSHEDFINLLPALPDAWKNGSFKGLRARGGYKVSAKWDNSRLVSFSILSEQDGTVEVRYNHDKWQFTLLKNQTAEVNL